MVEGFGLVIILLVAIIFIVVGTSRFKVHPFIILLLTAYGIAFASGMNSGEIAGTIAGGFGGILKYIGIVIICGTIIGTILEKSGAAITMADTVLKAVGEKRPALAMSIIGYIVSIPVFCDSGYVILSSLNKSLAKRTKTSMVTMAVALATGLYATHTLVPPTPGPIAAAANLGIDSNLLLVIVVGLLVSIPTMLVGYFWATRYCSRFEIADEGEVEVEKYEEIIAKYKNLPGPAKSFAPIVLPILLLALGSIAKFPGAPFGDGSLKTLLVFTGTPVNALFIGVLLSFMLLPKFDEETLSGWIGNGLVNAANIIMITGAGGALGAVIKATPIAGYIGQSLQTFNIGILLPFIIAAALKSAQGSSTVALVTTSAILAPLLGPMGFTTDIAKVLVVMAIGAGAMTVSHANDSYYWVVSQFSGMDVKTAYKSQTMATLLQGLSTIIIVSILTFIFV